MKYSDLMHNDQHVAQFNGVITLPLAMNKDVDNLDIRSIIKGAQGNVTWENYDICNLHVQRVGSERIYTSMSFQLLVYYKRVHVNTPSSRDINYSMVLIDFK